MQKTGNCKTAINQQEYIGARDSPTSECCTRKVRYMQIDRRGVRVRSGKCCNSRIWSYLLIGQSFFRTKSIEAFTHEVQQVICFVRISLLIVQILNVFRCEFMTAIGFSPSHHLIALIAGAAYQARL